MTSSLALGFQWSSATAGIKASGKPDIALAYCPGGATAAAMYTSNQLVAAPITIGRAYLKATGSKVTAVIVNAGNANCATGQAGLDGCRKSCIAVAEHFGCVFDEVFPSSTGIIGVPFPADKLIAVLPSAVAALGDSAAHAEAFATAILTTDTKLKIAHASFTHDGKTVNVFGCAKGAGMIGPQLVPHATMLVYFFTDFAATPAQLQSALIIAADSSFNNISIDGDTSTNDTVLLLASGKSGVAADSPTVTEAFQRALNEAAATLAHAIVDDGEGVTHVVTLDITGCRDDVEAKLIARSIAHSPLCKTAWSSGDPNWGRLLCAAGYSGVAFDPAAVTITIAGLQVFANGMRSPAFDEATTHAAMSAREYTIALDFGSQPEGRNAGHCRFLTCDLTHEYVSINADYST